MNRHDIDWKGMFTAIVTPFTKTGEIDESAYRENIENLMDEGIRGLVVTGCTGEFWSLTDDERIRVYQMAVETSKGKVPVIAGTMGMVTREVVELSNRAKAVGVDGVMITAPYYVMPKEKEIMRHYQDISSKVGLPILVYNIPNRVGINLTPDLLSKLCDVDCVVAVKQSSPSFDEVMQTIRLCGEKMRVFAGHSDTRGFPCIAMGADGGVSSVETQMLGKEAIQIYDAIVSGDFESARKIQCKSITAAGIARMYGVFPSGLKACMNLLGRPGGFPRPPVSPLVEQEIEGLRDALVEAAFI